MVGDTITTESTIPNQSQLGYRRWSDAIREAYLCDAIPPAEPGVIEEMKAENGVVTVETCADEAGPHFTHSLRLNDISFVNQEGERLTDLTLDEFGVLTTTVSTVKNSEISLPQQPCHVRFTLFPQHNLPCTTLCAITLKVASSKS